MGKAYKRDTCRLCGKNDFDKVLELTATPPADEYVSKERSAKPQKTYPIDLYLCRGCGVTQLLDVIDTDEVYLNYTYETVSSHGLVKHFETYAQEVMAQFKPKAGGLVLDIGSNDGTLLKFFKDRGMNILGIDPTPAIVQKACANGLPTKEAFFGEEYAAKLKKECGTAAVITCNNLVADIDNLGDLIKGVRTMMGADSVFLFESFYLVDQIENLVWDFTYHEHFSYFTVKPLKAYFDSLGLQLIDAQKIDTKGGSIRYKVQLKGGPHAVSPTVEKLIAYEEKIGAQKPEIFKGYRQRIEKAKRDLTVLLDDLKAKKKTIAAFGASATSTTLIYHYGLGGKIDFIVDDFKAKQGLFSPGFHIPVYAPDEIYKRKPDYILVLAWRFFEPILKNHQKYLDQGGQFIIPLPELKVIGAERAVR
jgi:SAM-dependent methyltransferase